jgi:cytoskeletal protein CcmA (bactofilin family)
MAAGESGAAVIGKSVQIRGEVNGSEDLIVDGVVEGTITLSDSRLTIGQTAKVSANVSARDVVVVGTLLGDVRASGKVELRQGSTLTGDLTAARLSIEENANFKGKVDLVQNAAAQKVQHRKNRKRRQATSRIPAASGAGGTPILRVQEPVPEIQG